MARHVQTYCICPAALITHANVGKVQEANIASVRFRQDGLFALVKWLTPPGLPFSAQPQYTHAEVRAILATQAWLPDDWS